MFDCSHTIQRHEERCYQAYVANSGNFFGPVTTGEIDIGMAGRGMQTSVSATSREENELSTKEVGA